VIPCALDPLRVRIAVAGRGAAARRRATLLAAGAPDLPLFTDAPEGIGAVPGNVVLRDGLPDAVALSDLSALWIAGLPAEEAARLARLARVLRVLVNVEDAPALCDFHSVAEVRRGHLLIAISTGGRSPGLAALVRRWIAAAFGPEWAGRTEAIGAQRAAWRAEGASMAEVAERTEAAVEAARWMP